MQSKRVKQAQASSYATIRSRNSTYIRTYEHQPQSLEDLQKQQQQQQQQQPLFSVVRRRMSSKDREKEEQKGIRGEEESSQEALLLLLLLLLLPTSRQQQQQQQQLYSSFQAVAETAIQARRLAGWVARSLTRSQPALSFLLLLLLLFFFYSMQRGSVTLSRKKWCTS